MVFILNEKKVDIIDKALRQDKKIRGFVDTTSTYGLFFLSFM